MEGSKGMPSLVESSTVTTIKQAEEKIVVNKYDTEAWLTLLGESKKEGDSNKIQKMYERFLLTFPTSGKYWTQYVEYVKSLESRELVEKMFKNCLIKCPDVELWKTYLDYVQKRLAHRADELKKTYDFTLEHIGCDVSAAGIWLEYLKFLKGSVVRHRGKKKKNKNSKFTNSNPFCFILKNFIKSKTLKKSIKIVRKIF